MIDSNQFQNPIEIALEAPYKSAIANRHRDTTKAKKRAGKAPLPRYALSTINQAPNTAQENTLGKHPYPLTLRPIYAILNTPLQLHLKSKSGQKQ